MVKALREAKKATSNAKFIARRHTQYAPKAGDLIACERRSLDGCDVRHVHRFRGGGPL